MKLRYTRSFICAAFIFAFLMPAVAQSGSQSDDDLFEDSTITSSDTSSDMTTSDSVPDSDLSHGILFRTGTVKIGGTYDTELTSTTAFSKDTDVRDSLWNTLFQLKADAQFTVDARPSENLRMYARFGIQYPYLTEDDAQTGSLLALSGTTAQAEAAANTYTGTLAQHLFYVKELFTDFSLGSNVNFRFGKHTVTWGTGYFFSPADVINLTRIDPEDPTKPVEGPLSLRTQIVFPGTQNCLWAYIIPDTDSLFVTDSSTYALARNTAVAAKGEVVLGGWELGLGGWYKNEKSPRVTATATGSIFGKVSVFAEGVGMWGTDSEWTNENSYAGKSPVWQGTAGLMYYWRIPQITTYVQYYYDGNTDDSSEGSNAAVSVNFAKIGTTDLTATVYCIAYTGWKKAIVSGLLTYTPRDELSIGAGPYFVWTDFDKSPVTSLKMTVKLGGGKF